MYIHELQKNIIDRYYNHLKYYGYLKDNELSKITASLFLLDSLEYFKDFIDDIYISDVVKILTKLDCCSCYINYSRFDSEFKNLLPKPYKRLHKLSDRQYFINFGDIDFESDKHSGNLENSGCSSIRIGNNCGRNLDWYWNDEIEFVVASGRTPYRYASLGCISASGMHETDITGVINYDKIKQLPYRTVDGINEYGLYCNINVVPTDTFGTLNQNRGKKRMPISSVVRYLLDHHKNAYDALNDIAQNFDLFSLNEFSGHIMCSDTVTGKTYILEYVNNVPHIIENSYMTNFHLYDVKYNSDETLDWNSVDPYGMGLERFEILRQASDDCQCVITDLMCNDLKYSKTYTDEDPLYWKTEFTGHTKHYGDITIHSTDAEFMPVIEIGRSNYEKGINGGAWITCHTAIYDLCAKTLNVFPFESESGNIFNLNDYI